MVKSGYRIEYLGAVTGMGYVGAAKG